MTIINLTFEEYESEVVRMILDMFPETIRMYMGINESIIRELIRDIDKEHELVEETIYDFYEDDAEQEEAAQELYSSLEPYFISNQI